MSRLHRTPLYGALAMALLASGSATAFAQSAPAPQVTETLHKIEVKAKALRKHRIPMNSAFSASRISPITIEYASPTITVQNLLMREPSINVSSPGPNGVRSSITFRAFNSG